MAILNSTMSVEYICIKSHNCIIYCYVHIGNDNVCITEKSKEFWNNRVLFTSRNSELRCILCNCVYIIIYTYAIIINCLMHSICILVMLV